MSTAPNTSPNPPQEKASAGMRLVALVGAVVLLFGAAVMILLVINPDDIPLCADVQGTAFTECFDITSAQYNISRVLAAPAGLIGAAAGMLGFYVAATGRRGDLMLRLSGIAIVLAGLAVLVNRAF